jgi:hypothetical protein
MSNLADFLGLEPDFDLESTVEEMVLNHEQYTEVKYPIYIPSKGRAHHGHTAKLLDSCGITNYKIVVEPQDYDAYVEKWGAEKVVQLPENDKGISYSRSYIKKYSREQGETFHWQMDDDMISFRLRLDNKNKKVDPRHCFSIVETVNDMFTNIGICGITHFAYAFAKKTAMATNKMVYGVILANNEVDHDWRPETNEDLDYSLQTLEKGYVTLAFNKVLFDTFTTGKLDGGNMLNLFAGDGRRKIYENTAALWPGRFVVKELDTDRGWTLKHTRRFYEDYKQKPKLK